MENLDKTRVNKPARNKKGQLLPGQTANPHGRPAGSLSITDAIKKKLMEVYIDPNDPQSKKTHLEKIIDTIMHNAIALKDARTLKDVWNYIDGLPKASVAIDVDKDNLQELTEFFKSVGKPNGKDA